MATCWPSTSSCFASEERIPRRLLISCSAHVESVYRAIEDWQSGKLIAQWWPVEQRAENDPEEPLSLFQRKLLWIIKRPPRVFGWCRTRWSCAALALTVALQTGITCSRETVRRELLAAGYVWKRTKLKARDDDPERARAKVGSDSRDPGAVTTDRRFLLV
jgi:Winged helix-turn helix